MQTHPFLTGISDVAPDPIFTAAAKATAAGPGALNATIGVILDESGKPLLFPSIAKALKELDTSQTQYPPLAGLPAFNSCVESLIFGPDYDANSVASIASTGGTGALSVLLRMAVATGYSHAIIPVPTWANHHRLVQGMGIEITDVPYIKDGAANAAALITELTSARAPYVVMLQAGCHNPTGQDFTQEDWVAICDTLADSNHIALIDFPYQGLGNGVEEDRLPVRKLAERRIPFLVAWSASKNHCIYGLRTGLATAYTPVAEKKGTLQKQLNITTRALTSVAPITGQQVVATVQTTYKQEWEQDLKALRELLAQKRSALAAAVPAFAKQIDRSTGMFVQLPLTAAHIQSLEDQQLFLTPDGRINIAGVALERVSELGSAITRVL